MRYDATNTALRKVQRTHVPQAMQRKRGGGRGRRQGGKWRRAVPREFQRVMSRALERFVCVAG
eukprot:356164-Chlamydomonas_euryale.AAC.3